MGNKYKRDVRNPEFAKFLATYVNPTTAICHYDGKSAKTFEEAWDLFEYYEARRLFINHIEDVRRYGFERRFSDPGIKGEDSVKWKIEECHCPDRG